MLGVDIGSRNQGRWSNLALLAFLVRYDLARATNKIRTRIPVFLFGCGRIGVVQHHHSSFPVTHSNATPVPLVMSRLVTRTRFHPLKRNENFSQHTRHENGRTRSGPIRNSLMISGGGRGRTRTYE